MLDAIAKPPGGAPTDRAHHDEALAVEAATTFNVEPLRLAAINVIVRVIVATIGIILLAIECERPVSPLLHEEWDTSLDALIAHPHGHTWHVTAWFASMPRVDARLFRDAVDGMLAEWDGKELEAGRDWNEDIITSFAKLPDCVEVRGWREADRLSAHWTAWNFSREFISHVTLTRSTQHSSRYTVSPNDGPRFA